MLAVETVRVAYGVGEWFVKAIGLYRQRRTMQNISVHDNVCRCVSGEVNRYSLRFGKKNILY